VCLMSVTNNIQGDWRGGTFGRKGGILCLQEYEMRIYS
jgi:hypothetical protein